MKKRIIIVMLLFFGFNKLISMLPAEPDRELEQQIESILNYLNINQLARNTLKNMIAFYKSNVERFSQKDDKEVLREISFSYEGSAAKLRTNSSAAYYSNLSLLINAAVKNGISWVNPIVSKSIKKQISDIVDRQFLSRKYQEEKAAFINLLESYVQEKVIESWRKNDCVIRYVINWQNINLSWCDCADAPDYKRFAVVIRIMHEVKKRYKLTDNLVYTSLASGCPLQDYLLIKELIHSGYRNLTINLIDFDFRKNDSRDTLCVKEIRCRFERLGKSLEIKNFPNVSFDVINLYTTHLEYLESCDRIPQLKSNILVMVDPGQVPLSVVGLYMSLANVLLLSTDDPKVNPLIMWYFPPYTYFREYHRGFVSEQPEKYAHLLNTAIKIDNKLRNLRHWFDFERRKIRSLIISNIAKDLKSEFNVVLLADPYLHFQELAIETLKPNGIVFQLGAGLIKDLSAINKGDEYLSEFEGSDYIIHPMLKVKRIN